MCSFYYRLNNRKKMGPLPILSVIHTVTIDTVVISVNFVSVKRCQDDIFPRIELIPSFVLSSDNTNYNNVI